MSAFESVVSKNTRSLVSSPLRYETPSQSTAFQQPPKKQAVVSGLARLHEVQNRDSQESMSQPHEIAIGHIGEMMEDEEPPEHQGIYHWEAFSEVPQKLKK